MSKRSKKLTRVLWGLGSGYRALKFIYTWHLGKSCYEWIHARYLLYKVRVVCKLKMKINVLLTRATDSFGSKRVSLLRRRLLKCSTTREKCSAARIQSFCNSDDTTSRTVVLESYLNDFVCPFSRYTLSTLGRTGMLASPFEKVEGWNERDKLAPTKNAQTGWTNKKD